MNRLLIYLFCFMASSASAQFSVTPVGLYETSDIGNWRRILLVYSDSTYEFNIKTDRGRYPKQPASGDSPQWQFDHSNICIKLIKFDGYQPKSDTYYLQSTGDLMDSNGKQWVKIGDIDQDRNLIKFKEETGRIVTYKANGYPDYSEEYKEGKLIKRETYFDLDSASVEEAKKYISKFRKAESQIMYYTLFSTIMRDFFQVVEVSESLIGGSWQTERFSRDGKRVTKE